MTEPELYAYLNLFGNAHYTFFTAPFKRQAIASIKTRILSLKPPDNYANTIYLRLLFILNS